MGGGEDEAVLVYMNIYLYGEKNTKQHEFASGYVNRLNEESFNYYKNWAERIRAERMRNGL